MSPTLLFFFAILICFLVVTLSCHPCATPCHCLGCCWSPAVRLPSPGQGTGRDKDGAQVRGLRAFFAFLLPLTGSPSLCCATAVSSSVLCFGVCAVPRWSLPMLPELTLLPAWPRCGLLALSASLFPVSTPPSASPPPPLQD